MKRNTLMIEDAQIIFRNFSGAKGQFNAEGDRNFCVILDPDVAAQLKEDGWNVKYLKPREEGDKEQPILRVKVNYKGVPPKIVLITSSGKSVIGEDEVGLLDSAEIKTVDLTISPYEWTIEGRGSGISAYLKTMYATIEEDEFEKKYMDIGGCGDCGLCDHGCEK